MVNLNRLVHTGNPVQRLPCGLEFIGVGTGKMMY